MPMNDAAAAAAAAAAWKKTADEWIEVARQAGQVARSSAIAPAVRRAYAYRSVAFPRVLELVLGARKDGTLTAARRAFSEP